MSGKSALYKRVLGIITQERHFAVLMGLAAENIVNHCIHNRTICRENEGDETMSLQKRTFDTEHRCCCEVEFEYRTVACNRHISSWRTLIQFGVPV